MAGKFDKTHPWRCYLFADVPWSHDKPEDGFILSGERMARTKAKMAEFVEHMRSEYGQHVVSHVYRVGTRPYNCPCGIGIPCPPNWRSCERKVRIDAAHTAI